MIVHSEVSLILELFCDRFVHFLQPYHIVLLILVCPLGFPMSYSSQFPSSSFSLASPCVPVGDFVTLVSFFHFYIIFILVFLPSFLCRIAAVCMLHMRASAG